MSAHASKGIRFVPKMPPLLGHAPSGVGSRPLILSPEAIASCRASCSRSSSALAFSCFDSEGSATISIGHRNSDGSADSPVVTSLTPPFGTRERRRTHDARDRHLAGASASRRDPDPLVHGGQWYPVDARDDIRDRPCRDCLHSNWSLSRPETFGAFAVVYILWGSTYLAIAVAVQSIPPFLLIGVRSLAAGAILLGFAELRNPGMPFMGVGRGKRSPRVWRLPRRRHGLQRSRGSSRPSLPSRTPSAARS
jgi:hypothetical protein